MTPNLIPPTVPRHPSKYVVKRDSSVMTDAELEALRASFITPRSVALYRSTR